MYNESNSFLGGENLEHNKTYNRMELNTMHQTLIIEGPITAEELQSYEFHKDLVAFRPASTATSSFN